MPIDLADYSTSIKVALKKSGFACVYVASVQCGRPCRVGYAIDLGAAIQRFQRFSPLPIVVEDVMWVPDRGIATTISQTVMASIAAYRQNGGWYDLTAESIASAVHLETFRLYPNTVTVPHNRLIAQWSGKRFGRHAAEQASREL
jgi:hypothetical protein